MPSARQQGIGSRLLGYNPTKRALKRDKKEQRAKEKLAEQLIKKSA